MKQVIANYKFNLTKQTKALADRQLSKIIRQFSKMHQKDNTLSFELNYGNGYVNIEVFQDERKGTD